MASKHICPKCGHDQFTTTAHVVQTWLVDKFGNFIDEVSSCDEVTHNPDDGNTWYCEKCGAEAILESEEAEECTV